MSRNRTQLALGLILVLVGAWFIAVRQVPALREWVEVTMTWPLNIVAVGALILFIGLLVGAPGMAVPAAIVAGIGGILYYQERMEDPSSWSYMWTLIPGFIGVGIVLSALLGSGHRNYREGFNMMFISAVLFLIFGTMFGGLTFLTTDWAAILLILLGVWIILRGFFKGRRVENKE